MHCAASAFANKEQKVAKPKIMSSLDAETKVAMIVTLWSWLVLVGLGWSWLVLQDLNYLGGRDPLVLIGLGCNLHFLVVSCSQVA